MTPDGYHAMLRAMGLTPCGPSIGGAKMHQTREGLVIRIIDADQLGPDQREVMIEIYKDRLNITDH